MRIIAVDDERLLLESLEQAIKDALEYARANRVDLAFLDIEMRGMKRLLFSYSR